MHLPLVVLIALAGLATGVLTQIGQGALPDDWSPVANAISPWLAVAFVAGAAMATRSWSATTR